MLFRLWQWDDDVGDTFTVGRPSKPIQTTSNDLEVEDDLTSEDNDNDDEYHSSLEEEEESIFGKNFDFTNTFFFLQNIAMQ